MVSIVFPICVYCFTSKMVSANPKRKNHLTWLICRDEIRTSYGIIASHYKNPYQPLSLD